CDGPIAPCDGPIAPCDGPIAACDSPIRGKCSPPPKRHVFEQQVEVLDRPTHFFPGPLLNLILPVRVDTAALDPSAAPPLLVLELRRRQRFAQQLLDAPESESHLLLALRQAAEKIAQGVVLGHCLSSEHT